MRGELGREGWRREREYKKSWGLSTQTRGTDISLHCLGLKVH